MSDQSGRGNNEEIARSFRDDGFVIVPGFLEDTVVEDAISALSNIVDGVAQTLFAGGTIERLFQSEPFESRMIRLFENRLDLAPKSFRRELHVSGLYALFFHSRLLDLVESLIGPEIRLYPNYTARPKLPAWAGTEVLWHQDGGYTTGASSVDAVATMHMINVWTPLVSSNVENGCMAFVPRSHLVGLVPHVSRAHYLEIAPESLDPLKELSIPIELDPGDIVLFDNLLFHCGLPNKSKTIRWSVDWRYQNATEPTNRREKGHIARSSERPATVVSSASEWASLDFG